MDDTSHKSGHLMLITPERVFYAGLLGRPRQRCSGGFNIYVAIEGRLWLTTAEGRETHGDMVALLPNVRHTIASDHRSVLSVVIEPESVRPGALEDLATRLTDLGDAHEGVHFATIGWILPGTHDPDGHEVRFYSNDHHTDLGGITEPLVVEDPIGTEAERERAYREREPDKTADRV
jgi:hypothetical protein